MPRMVYITDGTSEVVFCDVYDTKSNLSTLERILYDRLGKDVVDLLHTVTDPEINGLKCLEDEVHGYESTCESYHDCLTVVFNGLHQISNILEQRHPSRQEISGIIKKLQTLIEEEI